MANTDWLSKEIGATVNPPSETEWEKAAHGSGRLTETQIRTDISYPEL